MAITDKINLQTRFQLNATPNEKFRIQDTTDYASEGIALADVIGALVIYNPLGVPIHTTTLPSFDIDLDVQDYIDTIDLPTDSNGDVMKGAYRVVYTVRVSGGVQPGDYTKEFAYSYCYEEIIPNITIEVDQICSKLTSTDNTALPVQTTSNTLTHEIHPPVGLDPSDYPISSVPTTVNEYTPITTKTWTSKVTNVIELTFPSSSAYDEHFIDVTIVGSEEKEIRDDINRCSLKCNMEAMTTSYFSKLGTNSMNAVKQFNEQVAPALLAAFNYESALVCGNFEEAEQHYNEVLKFTGSNKNCECGTDDPMLITPTCVSGDGSGQTYVVDACGVNSALTVTGVTLGDTTTFTVCFDDSMWQKLQSLTETIITSTDGSVTIVPVLNGYNLTWDLSVSASPASSPVHSFSGIIEIAFDSTNAPPTIEWDNNYDTLVGNKLQKPTIVNENNVPSSWFKLQNCFYLSDYVDQSGGEFPIPQIQVVSVSPVDSDPNPCRDTRGVYANIMDVDESSNRIYFNLADRSIQLTHPTGAWLDARYRKIRLSVIINA